MTSEASEGSFAWSQSAGKEVGTGRRERLSPSQTSAVDEFLTQQISTQPRSGKKSRSPSACREGSRSRCLNRVTKRTQVCGEGPQVEAGPAARGAAGPHTLSLPRSSTGCGRNWPPAYVNSPMVKLASLHSISPQSQEPIGDVTYNRT